MNRRERAEGRGRGESRRRGLGMKGMKGMKLYNSREQTDERKKERNE